MSLCVLDMGNRKEALAELQGSLNGIGKARARGLPILLGGLTRNNQAVNDRVDIVLLVPVQVDIVVEGMHDAVNAGADKPGLADLFEHRLVGALATAHHGCEHHDTTSIRERLDGVHDLLGRLSDNLAPANWAVRNTRARKQQTKIIVDLRHRAHGGTRIMGCAFLIDRNSGRKTLDVIHIGLIHLSQKLPGVSRKGLDVAALALREDRVEGEGGLA